MLNGLDLFSGIGGMSIALKEWVQPITYCEIDPYCQGVLFSRMADKSIYNSPIWDDVRTLQGSDFRGAIDIIYGGSPCQGFSVAGLGKGLADERSGLFFEIMRLAKEIQPTFIFLENVPAITTRGGLQVVREIAEMGYDSRWCVISAASVGAPHKRDRWFLLAHTNNNGSPSNKDRRSIRECSTQRKGTQKPTQSEWQAERTSRLSLYVANTRCECERSIQKSGKEKGSSLHVAGCSRYWEVEPSMGGTFDGLSSWLDENKLMLIKSHKCIMTYVKHLGENGKTIEENRIETMRILQNQIQQEIDRESIRGFLGISAKKILLTYLCKLEKTSETLDDLSLQSEEIQERILRSLWAQKKFARTSHRSKYSKQYDREHTNSLQALSRFLAYDSEEAWTSYRWENAKPILSEWKDGWEDGIERMADGIRFRVDRIKCLGNAVVPAQAKKAFKILMGLE